MFRQSLNTGGKQSMSNKTIILKIDMLANAIAVSIAEYRGRTINE
jgi:hypothetical protein